MTERQTQLRYLIIEALKNAETNDYNFDGWTMTQIAGDMIAYDDDISGMVQDGDHNFDDLESEIVGILGSIGNDKWRMF